MKKFSFNKLNSIINMGIFGIFVIFCLVQQTSALFNLKDNSEPSEKPDPKISKHIITNYSQSIIDFEGIVDRNTAKDYRGSSLTGSRYALHNKYRFAKMTPSAFPNWKHRDYPTIATRGLTNTTPKQWLSEKRTIRQTSFPTTTESTHPDVTKRPLDKKWYSSIKRTDRSRIRQTTIQTETTTRQSQRKWFSRRLKITQTTPQFLHFEATTRSSQIRWGSPVRRNRRFQITQNTTTRTPLSEMTTKLPKNKWYPPKISRLPRLYQTTIPRPEPTTRSPQKKWYHPIMWDNWTFWGPCSRTCGQGIKVRTRQCLVWDGEKFSRTHITGCTGPDIGYKICHRRKCSSHGLDYRSEQCSLLSRKPFLTSTKYLYWTPYYSRERPCDLNCKADTRSRFYNFGTVQDGTRCHKTGSSICIRGDCKVVGCDGVVESTVTIDSCGVCNGKNDTCDLVQATVLSEFPNPDTDFPDYSRIVTIPRGARNIKILDNSRNNLALMDSRNKFIINGDRLVQDGGQYKIAGTTMNYIKSQDTLGEIITGDGPITEDITVMLLYRQKNHEIKYEFWKSKISNSNSSRRSKTIQSRQSLTGDPVWIKVMSDSKDKNTAYNRNLYYSSRRNHVISSSNEVFDRVQSIENGKKHKYRKIFKKKQKLKFKKKNCPKCWKVKDKKKQFCQSDFVARILVRGAEIIDGETRYDVTVIKTYKDGRVKLMSREYIWVPNVCKCPKLKVDNEFIVMGILDSVRHREIRLTLTPKQYVRKYKPKYESKLHKMRRKRKC